MKKTKEVNAREMVSPRDNEERKTVRKLPQVDASVKRKVKDGASSSLLKESIDQDVPAEKATEDSDFKEVNNKESPSRNGSVAYISETLITQITKEHRLDLIKSLTIHLPKDKLNKKIKYIENLEKLTRLQSLNLSNNMIEKMQKLETLVELRELNLANNCLKVIECVDHMSKLQVLNLSGNQITSIPGATMKKLRCLKVVKLSHNKLETLLDVTRLRPLQDLTNLDLQGNPFTSLAHYRQFVIFQLRSLEILDNQAVTKEERFQADQRFAQEEVRRLEVEIAKQEKLYQKEKDENDEAKITVEHLKTTQKSSKIKEAKQTDRIKELERDIEATNGLLRAKNLDLIKSSENLYRLEQELAFYKLDAKFELLGQMPVVDNLQMDEERGLDDSTYIGKATFKANKFTRESNVFTPEQIAHMESLRRKYEEDEKMRDNLDHEIQVKREAMMQLEELLEKLAQDIDDKNDELRNTSEKLASLETSLASQMATLGQGNELARKQLAEKIEFIKRLQEAADQLENRMKIVANDVAEKQRELEELGRKVAKHGNDGDDDNGQFDLHQALSSKQAELQNAYAELSKMKDDLEMLKNRIAQEEAEAEMLRRQLEKDNTMSEEAIGQLKNELEGVIDGLKDHLEELQNHAREQQAKIKGLEKERDIFKAKLTKGKEMERNLEGQLNDAIQALREEEEKGRDLEGKEKELRDRLLAFDKNNKLGLIEAQAKLKHADEENERLQDVIKKLKDQIENERKAAKARVQRDQERIAKALDAARGVGNKEKELKGLALQVSALKATNEALNDRFEEAEDELRRREKDCLQNDAILERLNDLLNDLEQGKKEVKQPFDKTDGVGQCLADLHKKYLELENELENEKQKGRHKQKQAKAAIDTLKTELAQAQSQLNAAEAALAQLSQEGTEHDADLKTLENDIYKLQDNLRTALDKAEEEASKRARDKNAYEKAIQALEDEIGKLQNEQNDKRNQKDDEVNHVRALAAKQKDRLENEIQELQDELQKLKDKQWNELRRKDEEISELETLLAENAPKLLSNGKSKEKDDLSRELEDLRRLVFDRTKATQVAINQEVEMKRAQREQDDNRRKIDEYLINAQNKVHDLEKLLDAKNLRGFEHDHTVAALIHELETLKTALAKRDLELASAVGRTGDKKQLDGAPTTETHHHIYTHDTQANHDPQPIHRYHYDNILPVTKRNREYTVLQTPADVSAATALDQFHHHHHYGNGDFTLNLKKKKSRKKDYCNISEHEDLEDDVMFLEDKLATSKSKLASQITENKLGVLRSDLQSLEHTVSDSFRRQTPVEGLQTHLDETLAKLQDHLLTLMDHRTNLLSQKT